MSGSDYGHDHPTGMASVVDAGRSLVSEVAWSLPGPLPAGGSSFGLGRRLIWSYVGSNLLPRASFDVVEDGDAGGSPLVCPGWEKALVSLSKIGVVVDGFLACSPYVDAYIIGINNVSIYRSAREAR